MMINNRHPVPGGPIKSCVQCPTCQVFVPVSTHQTPTTVQNTPVRAMERHIVPQRTLNEWTPEQVPSSDISQPTTIPTVRYSTIRSSVHIATAPSAPAVFSRVNPMFINNTMHISDKEQSWQSAFPKMPVYLLAFLQIILTILNFILEIASLAVLAYQVAASGIWCAIPFFIAGISTFILDDLPKKNRSRIWATRALIAQLILLIFTFIFVGITGSYVQNGGYFYSSYVLPGSYQTKYRIIQAQLAFGILLMFSGFAYVAIYLYVTLIALWRPFHTLDISDHCRQILRF